MGEEATSVRLPGLEYADDLEKQRAATALHAAQDEPGFNGLLAGRLTADAWERMYPEQENVPQKIFGGYLIRRAYELSSIWNWEHAISLP
jgi:hypothetical protein